MHCWAASQSSSSSIWLVEYLISNRSASESQVSWMLLLLMAFLYRRWYRAGRELAADAR